MRHWIPITVGFVLGLSQLGAHEESKYGWLGAYTQDLNQAMKVALSVDHGVLVTRVIEDSPAESAGLKLGDLILTINSEEIRDEEELHEFVRKHPNVRVSIEILRQGRRQRVPVILGERERPCPRICWRKVEEFDLSEWLEKLIPPERIQKQVDEALEELRRELERLRAELEELKAKLEKRD